MDRKTPADVWQAAIADLKAGPVHSSSIARSQTGAALPKPQVPDHELLQCIGKGAYGEVWLARNIMGAFRAVKVVYRGSFDHDRPFEREFDGIRRFEPVSRTHESQLNVLHVGRGEGYFYYVMELADDQRQAQEIDPASYAPRTLRSELHLHGRLPFEQCLRIALALTTALDHLHEHGLVHRDIKPSNVIIVNGIPKLADIGLVAQADATLSFVGTEGYVPPEGPGSPQADIYSLGKLLYEISTGKDRQDYPELPEDLRELPDREGVVELNEVIIRACQAEPRRRYATAGAMHQDLVLLQGGKSLARLRVIERRLARWKRAGLVGTTVTIMVAAGLAWQAHETGRLKALAAENLALARRSQQSAAQSRERLVRTEVINGARLLDQGDLLESLLWFGQAANLDRDNAQHQAMHQLRIQSTLGECPKLAHIFFHAASIEFAGFSKDGKRLVTGSADRTARVWEVASGQPVSPVLEHKGLVYKASLSPAGDRLATASLEKIARVWDLRTGKVVFSVTGAGDIFLVAFSPDGRLLFTTGSEGQRAWDAATGQPLWPRITDIGRTCGLSPDGRYFATAGPTARVREAKTGRLAMETAQRPSRWIRVAFSPDSQRIVTGGADGTVQVWDIATGQPAGEAMRIQNLDLIQFSPDGTRVLVTTTALQDDAAIWTIATTRRVALKHQAYLHDAEFSPDGRFVATAGSDGVARLWDVQTGEPASPALVQGGPALQVKFSPDGHLLFTAGQDGTGRLWDLTEMGIFDRKISDSGMNFAELSPDGHHVVTAGDEGTAQVWDTATGQPLGQPMRHPKELKQAAFSADGLKVITASDKTARIWDWASGQALSGPLQHDALVTHAGFSADGRLVITTSEDATAQVWNAETGKPVGPRLHHSGVVRDAAISPDGKLALTISDYQAAQLWEIETGKALIGSRPDPDVRGDKDQYQVGDRAHVEFSPDGRSFLTQQDVTRVWEVGSRKPLTGPLTLGSAEVYATFSPDGRRVATGAVDGAAEVWDARNGRALTAPMRHSQWVYRLAFDHAGQRLATASLDKTARVWDAATGQPLTPPLGHGAQVVQVAFSADGRWLLTLTADGVTRLWDLSVSSTSLERTTQLIEVMANRHSLTETEATPLTPEELRGRWEELYPGGGAANSARPETLLRWHERQAAQSEAAREWFGAIFHLNCLITARPADNKLLHRRAVAYERNGQWNKAVADDPAVQRSIPLRDPQTRPDLVDLGAYYNWPLNDFAEGLNNLASFPAGVQTLGGVPFDVRGAIHLTDPSSPAPHQANTIRIQLKGKCARLHFLHSAIFGDPSMEGQPIGKYVLRYAQKDLVAELPIVYGRQVRDWASLPGECWAAPELEVAWRGTNGLSPSSGRFVRLFKTTWENPHPEAEIKTLELVPEPSIEAAPFVLAITMDPPGSRPTASLKRPPNAGLLPQIPPRDPQAGPELIDLSDFYTAALTQDAFSQEGNNLRNLPTGVQVFGGVPFDVRCMVRLGGTQLPSKEPQGPWDDERGFPQKIPGIRIHRTARRLHFLQACLGNGGGPEGRVLGRYIVHFTAGPDADIPVRYKLDTAHWFEDAPKARLVWSGVQESELGMGTKHLYLQTWENPWPEREIATLDFVSQLDPKLAPFLVALTAQ